MLEDRKEYGRGTELPAEFAGCYAARSHHFLIPPSRTEHILSRYRPIAPKPSVVKQGESAGSAPSQSSSTLSFERASTKGTSLSSDGSRGKRTRKRSISDSMSSPKGIKRAPPPLAPQSCRADNQRSVSCTSVPVFGGIEKAVEQFSPKCGNEFATGRIDGFPSVKDTPSPGVVTEMAPHYRDLLSPLAGSFDRRKHAYGFGGLGIGNVQHSPDRRLGMDLSMSRGGLNEDFGNCVSDKDTGFMERAAASAPGAFSGNYYHGLNGTPSKSAGLNSFSEWPAVHVSEVSTPFTSSPLNLSGSRSTFWRANHHHPNYASLSASYVESEVCSEEEAQSRKENIVTLSLLPDTPSHEQSSSEAPPSSSSIPFVPLTMSMSVVSWEVDERQDRSEAPTKPNPSSSRVPSDVSEEEERAKGHSSEKESSWGREAQGDDPAESSVVPMKECSDKASEVVVPTAFPGEETNDHTKSPVIDCAYLEQVYLTSSDPVVLTDEGNTIFWENLSFTRAALEKFSGNVQVMGPYLDPLGIPTQLSQFIYRSDTGIKTKAVLWGFLKKFMMLETKSLRSGGNSGGENLSEERNFFLNPKQHGKTTEFSQVHTVIAPQPIRPVGSTLNVECVVKVNQLAPPITDNFEAVKEKMELDGSPTVITDTRNRVRWVNMAYKQMVGQPECSWFASTVGRKSASRGTPQYSRLMGEVLLICNEELPQLSAIFSCRVRVQWNNQGKEKTITVLADVARIESDRMGNMYVWKLDTQANG